MNPNPWERDPGGMHVCMKLVQISKAFGSDARVELKFLLSPCHGILGGELRLHVPSGEAAGYLVGDEYSVRMRSI